MSAPWGSAEGLIDAPIGRVLAHLTTEFDRMVGRVPYLKRAEVIKRNARAATVYFYFKPPWLCLLCSDRDYTVTYRWGRAADGHVGIVIETDNDAGPRPGDALRVKMLRGQ